MNKDLKKCPIKNCKSDKFHIHLADIFIAMVKSGTSNSPNKENIKAAIDYINR